MAIAEINQRHSAMHKDDENDYGMVVIQYKKKTKAGVDFISMLTIILFSLCCWSAADCARVYS